MTFRALNNREELDKAVIAAQAEYDRLGKLMNELGVAQAKSLSPARIGNLAFEAHQCVVGLAGHIATVFTAVTPDLTYVAPPEPAWVADDRRQA